MKFAVCFVIIGSLFGIGLGQNDCTIMPYAPEIFGSPRKVAQGACSGHGTCVSVTDDVPLCACDAGWTGRSSIINTEGMDCQINETIVKVFWGFNLLVGTIYVTIALPRIKIRYNTYLAVKESKRAQGIHYSIIRNRGLLSCFLMIFVCYPATSILALLKIFKTNERIGVTWGVSLMFGLGRFGFYYAVWLFQPALIRTILRGKKATQKMIQVADYVTFAICTWSVIIGFTPFIAVGADDPTGHLTIVAYYLYVLGTVVQLAFFGIQAWYLRREVLKVLSESYSVTKSTKILEIKDAIGKMQKEVYIHAAIQFVIYSIFIFWPLMNAMDYFYPFGILTYPIMIKKTAFTTVSSKSGDTSSVGKSTINSIDVPSDQNSKVGFSTNPQATDFQESVAESTQVMSKIGQSFTEFQEETFDDDYV